MTIAPVFDPIAEAYDEWYDAPEGNAIFREEIACLRLLCGDFSGRWLEVGVGTGRFAAALGISLGIDLSFNMAAKAASRGIEAQVARAEQLPFKKGSFDGALMALTLCFLEDPVAALSECARVMRDDGRLIVGTVPADSSWGKAYVEKGAEGHPAYSYARFYTVAETLRMAEKAGFELLRSRSALFWKPDRPPDGLSKTTLGTVEGAGFVGLLFKAARSGD